MANTYVALDSQTVTSAVTSITFSSIPQIYTDLVVVVNASLSNNTPLYMKPNSSSSSVYSTTWLLGNGTAVSSSRYNQAALGGAGILIDNYGGQPGFPSDFSGTARYEIMNYSNTTTFKQILIRAGTATNWSVASANLFASTSAISSLYFYPYAGTFAVGSTFTLYGVAATTVSAKATGGFVYTDSNYFYHIFNATGAFVPTTSLTADVLVVAGGGGGGMRNNGGGGGAGGVLAFASQSLTTTSYTATVGGGGSSNAGGSNSQFAGLTASVGGGGGGSQSGTANGGTGGSGGGAGWTGTAGAATSGQGNAGGTSNNGTYLANGGGGGKGSAGGNGNATSGLGGAGGDGVNTVTNWGDLTAVLTATNYGVSGYIAGGGGGSSSNSGTQGAAGSGGGTAGSSSTASSNATANTGSGAGGVSTTSVTAGNGGSGLVIVRYAV